MNFNNSNIFFIETDSPHTMMSLIRIFIGEHCYSLNKDCVLSLHSNEVKKYVTDIWTKWNAFNDSRIGLIVNNNSRAIFTAIMTRRVLDNIWNKCRHIKNLSIWQK